MSKEAPVSVWMSATEAVEAGVFTWRPDVKVGAFEYSASYLARDDAFPLDPVKLPLKRGQFKETLQHGMFGILRDSGPDGWGRDVLWSAHGPLDEFDYLVRGSGDGSGVIAAGGVKLLKGYSLAEIDAASLGFPPNDAVRKTINPTTSMGGAKPKLLAFDEGAYWVAKFPQRADHPRLESINEHVMLSMARDCGLDACDTKTHALPDGRIIHLAKRFDIESTPEGCVIQRGHYASAHTVLQLDSVQESLERRNYLAFASRAVRWAPDFDRFELWKRIAYNAMVSNRDDHPRNHALLRIAGAWKLSPAFDIVAAPVAPDEPFALAMGFHSKGAEVSVEAVYEAATMLGLALERCCAWAQQAAAIVHAEWRGRLSNAGASDEEIARLGSRLGISDALKDFVPPPPDKRRQRFRKII